ncbi:hypothetical protein GDR29_13175 [Xanthomonas oryzae pv. oryzae]|nr:hypothetical protein GDR29_13175 [Xanthomonas oryzae pv. oryzae]
MTQALPATMGLFVSADSVAFISFEQAGGRSVVAFLDMVAWAEGTDKPSQPTKDHGYDVLVGGGPFDRYADHPYVPALRVFLTAAGRYQLLRRY